MAVAFKTALGTQVAAASGTTLVITTTAAIAVGDLVVVRVAADNLTASTPTATCADSGGNSYTNLHQLFGPTATAAGGVTGALLATRATTAVATGGTITVTVSGAVVARAAVAESFTGVDNTTRFAPVGATGTAGAVAPAATGTVVAGDLVLGWASMEMNSVTVTQDNDTTGGAWSTMVQLPNVTVGSGTSGTRVTVSGQWKIPSSGGAQSWSVAGAAGDCVGGVVVLTPTPAITQAAYQLYADGTETGSAALAALNTAPTVDVTADANIQVRVRLQSTDATAITATDDWQLQWERNTSGTWTSLGAPVLTDSYPETNYDSAPNLAQAAFLQGQSFRGNGAKLLRVRFWGYKQGTGGADNVTAFIYAHTGNYGVGGTATGAALATSTPVPGTSVVGTSAAKAWNPFVFDGTFTLTNNTPYVLAVGRSGGTTDFSNYMAVGADASSPTHGGNSATFSGGSWIGDTTQDLIFELYTEATTVVVPYNSANLTDGAATTNRLGAGSGTFTAGKVSEDGLVDDVGWSGNNYTELVYSVTLKAVDLAAADTLKFRVVRNGATTGLTYTQTPTVTIAKGAPPVSTGKFKVWNGSAWVEKPAKVWNGSSWVEKPVKVWTGSAWVLA